MLFLFGHEPMSPTLMDAFALIDLDVTSPLNHADLQVVPHHKILKLHQYDVGGWRVYVNAHNKEKCSVRDREHTAFLMM
jgi:hypothetical protein